jgi:Mg2+-importing ATPase
MGTPVVSGSARALICRTGANTVLGDIAGSLASRVPPTAFEQGTRQFGGLIMRLTTLLVLFVLMVNVLLHRPLLESFLFAIALAVGLTPELLPMVVSVTLSRGALRMAKRHVIIKRLAVIHNLGSMNVLCTDKTGTFTEARIELAQHVDAQGRDATGVLRLACLNSHFETGLRSPLDEAILAHANADANVAGWRKIDEVPFDFEPPALLGAGRRRPHPAAGSEEGAPEDIVRLCTHCADGDPLDGDPSKASRPMDGPARAEVQALRDRLAAEGLRVLGIAWRSVPGDHPHARVDDETDLVFAGFAAFLDPPKASAAAALKALATSGVAVKIVTGDNELVTRHVCERLGMPVNGVLTGAQVQCMDDNALGAPVESVNLFCRVTPSQKNRIILALKARGHTVGYLGDGVNDAPSLHSADVGISVDGAVDVAKEAADMILLKHDLRVLHEGVIEGRRTFGNIMKYIMMGTSSNFGNMFSMAGATLFLPFLPMLPVQILLNNLLYDVSEIAIPTDRVDPGYVARPHHWDMRFIRNFMLVIGPVSSAFDFLTYFVLLRVFDADEALFHTGWFIESLCTQVLVIFIIRTRGSPLRSGPSGWLTATSLVVVGAALLLPLAPFASRLGFVPPPPLFFLALAAMTAAYLFAVEGAKRVFYARLSGRSATTRRARQP